MMDRSRSNEDVWDVGGSGGGLGSQGKINERGGVELQYENLKQISCFKVWVVKIAGENS